jgi:hypothetical protein
MGTIQMAGPPIQMARPTSEGGARGTGQGKASRGSSRGQKTCQRARVLCGIAVPGERGRPARKGLAPRGSMQGVAGSCGRDARAPQGRRSLAAGILVDCPGQAHKKAGSVSLPASKSYSVVARPSGSAAQCPAGPLPSSGSTGPATASCWCSSGSCSCRTAFGPSSRTPCSRGCRSRGWTSHSPGCRAGSSTRRCSGSSSC